MAKNMDLVIFKENMNQKSMFADLDENFGTVLQNKRPRMIILCSS